MTQPQQRADAMLVKELVLPAQVEAVILMEEEAVLTDLLVCCFDC